MKSGFLAALALSACINNASAALVVDTGEPANDYAGVVVASYQFVAGRFTTTEAFKITGLSAYVANYSCCGVVQQEMTLSIAAGPADPMNATMTRLVSGESTFTLDSGTKAWESTAVADYLLAPGTYWIIASVDPGQDSFGLAMPFGDLPNPLETYAFHGDTSLDPGNFIWRPDPAQNKVGFRIEGDQVHGVPEPAGIALFGLGLAALLAQGRRTRRA